MREEEKEFILNNHTTMDIYRNEMMDALKLSFPNLYEDDIRHAIEYSIAKRAKDTNVRLDNNYEKTKQNTTLFKVTDYIINNRPIITTSGVMFKRHGSEPNPYVDLIQEFLSSRAKYKKLMFKSPKGSQDFEKYNILQQSEKVSGNAMYGASGMCTSIFYNLYIAKSITMQGRNCISTAIMLFEATMANNVKFSNLDDVVTFINNVRRESGFTYSDSGILDENITVEECFYKLLYSCGFYWIPTEKEMTILWDMLNQCTQHEINLLFYKNNLFWFIDNQVVMNQIITILSKLDIPFLDPNEPPSIIKDDLDKLYQMIYEWVYYDKQYVDRLDRAENMYRCVSVITDTDSCFISFDGWYRYILGKTYNIPMKIKNIEIQENTGEINVSQPRYDYDFYTDEIIEMQQSIKPDTILPQVGFRCSIINILAHIMGKLSIDYLNKYSGNSNTTICEDGTTRSSFFILKNEFQIKRALVTDNKKNYATYQERQESNIIPRDKALDIKGMPITKVGLPEITKQRLQQILFDQVLDNDGQISQVDIVKQLAIFEKQITESILAGNKDFYKPARIKAESAYDDPMRNYAIKASVIWNKLRLENEPIINLTERNSILVIDVDITEKNCNKIQDKYPDKYKKIMNLFESWRPQKWIEKGITKIAIMEDWDVPDWVKEFIDYIHIINNNLKTFPCEALGISRDNRDSINYTNIVKL